MILDVRHGSQRSSVCATFGVFAIAASQELVILRPGSWDICNDRVTFYPVGDSPHCNSPRDDELQLLSLWCADQLGDRGNVFDPGLSIRIFRIKVVSLIRFRFCSPPKRIQFSGIVKEDHNLSMSLNHFTHIGIKILPLASFV